MKRRILLLAVCAIVFLSGCSAPKQEPAKQPVATVMPDAAVEEDAMDEAVANAMDQAFEPPVATITPDAAGEEAIMDKADASPMDQAFVETIRSGGAALPDVEYNGAGKLAAYYREFMDGSDKPPTFEDWDSSFLPDGLAAEKPEDAAAVVIIDMSAMVMGATSNSADVGKPVEQKIRYKVSFHHPQSWRCVLKNEFFGKAVPVGSYTVKWAALSPPSMDEVREYIQNTLPQYEAIPVSSSWQAFDDAFGAFVDGHYDEYGTMTFSDVEKDALRDRLTTSYNGAGKLAACFTELREQIPYWTDSIIPEKLRAESPEDVSAIVVVQYNEGYRVASVDLLSVSGEDMGGSGLAWISMDEYPDFSAWLGAIEDSILSLE